MDHRFPRVILLQDRWVQTSRLFRSLATTPRQPDPATSSIDSAIRKSSTLSSCSALPTSPLTNEQQVGNSALGTLCHRHFPKWLDEAGGACSQAPCVNRTTKNSDATAKNDVPNTNMTRYYDLTISRERLSPDDVLRDMILVNGQFPGPLIEANWGDWIQVCVHNNITDLVEGTVIH